MDVSLSVYVCECLSPCLAKPGQPPPEREIDTLWKGREREGEKIRFVGVV